MVWCSNGTSLWQWRFISWNFVEVWYLIYMVYLRVNCVLVHHRNNIQLKETKCSEILLVGTSTEVNFIRMPVNSFIQLPTNLFWRKLCVWNVSLFVKFWNKWVTEFVLLQSIRMGALCLYTISRNKRYLAGSVLKLMNAQVNVGCQNVLTYT